MPGNLLPVVGGCTKTATDRCGNALQHIAHKAREDADYELEHSPASLLHLGGSRARQTSRSGVQADPLWSDWALAFPFSLIVAQEQRKSAAEAVVVWQRLAASDGGRSFSITLLLGPALRGRG